MKNDWPLVVIGGSAGSLQALFRILENLSPEFSLPILLVMHRVTSDESSLAELLASKTHLRISPIEEKESIEPGTLFICPPDYHVLIESDESFSLDASEKVNFSRPSLDVVFRSAADVLGRRVIAILLSGANADGANGLAFVQEKGGTTIVQDPAEAQVAYMPQQALKVMQPDLVMTSASIGKWLNEQPQL